MITYSKLQLYLLDVIHLNNIGNVYIPKIKDILDIGENEYNKLLLPFCINKDVMEDDFLEKFPWALDFDLFFFKLPNNESLFSFQEGNRKRSYLDLLLEALEFFLRKSVFLDENNRFITVGNQNNIKYIINRDNFGILADLILESNNIGKFKKEKMPIFKNERQKEVYLKIIDGRKRHEEKFKLSLLEMVKAIRYGSKSIVSFEELLNLTIYQLYEDCNGITTIDSWNREFQKGVTGNYKSSDLDLDPYWLYRLK